jgi:hypothetical protein
MLGKLSGRVPWGWLAVGSYVVALFVPALELDDVRGRGPTIGAWCLYLGMLVPLSPAWANLGVVASLIARKVSRPGMAFMFAMVAMLGPLLTLLWLGKDGAIQGVLIGFWLWFASLASNAISQGRRWWTTMMD